MRKVLFAMAATGGLVPGSAMAAQMLGASASFASPSHTVSGQFAGTTWTARSLIVGQTSTSTLPTGGSLQYLGFNKPGYSGVVGLLMRYDTGAGFVCSGSLLSTGRILTAAHCVSDGAATDINGRAPGLVSTTAFFYDGVSQGIDPFVYPSAGTLLPGITAIPVSFYHVVPGYTGQVIDHNDLAVLTLSSAAPSFAQRYELFDTNDLTSEIFNVAGYGTRSTVGGAEGTTGPGAGAGVGRLRQGDNLYDYRLGDEAFGDGFSFLGDNYQDSYISDFDNGDPAFSQACRVAGALTDQVPAAFCNSGLGSSEVSIAGGDSGGPGFVGGRIATVNSYGLTFGTGFGDFKPGLQSSWGELNGFVPTYIHARFIAAVPEPSTWGMMLLGFGSVGMMIRRRERKVKASLAS